jgi:hypothetical protein
MRSIYIGGEFLNVFRGDMSMMWNNAPKVKQFADQLRDLVAMKLDHDIIITTTES